MVERERKELQDKLLYLLLTRKAMPGDVPQCSESLSGSAYLVPPVAWKSNGFVQIYHRGTIKRSFVTMSLARRFNFPSRRISVQRTNETSSRLESIAGNDCVPKTAPVSQIMRRERAQALHGIADSSLGTKMRSQGSQGRVGMALLFVPKTVFASGWSGLTS